MPFADSIFSRKKMLDLCVNFNSSAVIILHWHHTYKWVFTSLLDAFPSSLFRDAKHGYTTNLAWLFHPKDEQRLLVEQTKRPFINMNCVTDQDREGRLGMTQADPKIAHPLCHNRAVKISHGACEDTYQTRDQKALCGGLKITYLVNIPHLWFSLIRTLPLHVYMKELLVTRSRHRLG